MQLRGPAPHVVHLHLAQGHAAGRGEGLQALERLAVHRERAGGEAALDLQVLEMAPQVVVERAGGAVSIGCGCSRMVAGRDETAT